MIVPVILSGGSGTRLWPMSTADRPKQFLALTGDATMLQLTCRRCFDPARFAAPIIVGNARHAGMVVEQLEAIGISRMTIILEPAARNTAPAIALAALEAGSGGTLLLVMPSDHVIADEAAFLAAVDAASPAACEGWLVTFGITPTHAETGYGYIEMSDEAVGEGGARRAARFVEKPPLADAEAMVAGGRHLWNAGIFLFRADAYLDALGQFASDMLAAVRQSHDQARRDGNHVHPDADAFTAAPSDSIDYAVMERAEHVAVMPVSCGWSDLGSWDALHAIGGQDAAGNQIVGDVVAENVTNVLIRSDGVSVAISGVSDIIVIASGNDVLILPRGQSQDVKRILAAHQRRKQAE